MLSILQNPILAKETLDAGNRDPLVLTQVLLKRLLVETQEESDH